MLPGTFAFVYFGGARADLYQRRFFGLRRVRWRDGVEGRGMGPYHVSLVGLLRNVVILAGALLLLGLVSACSGGTGTNEAEEPANTADGPDGGGRQGRNPGAGLLASEEADGGLGERVGLGDVSLRLFDVRDEDILYYAPGPGERVASKDSPSGEFVAVDFVVTNDSASPVTVRPETLLGDAAGGTHRPEEPLEAAELRAGQSRASTLFFAVPNGTTPERLGVRLAGSGASLDLLSDRRGEIPPADHLRVYHLYFQQKAYEEAYEMYDPASTQDVTLGDWLTFYEPLWGSRYLRLDSLTRVFVVSDEASFEMDRTFYARDGDPVADPILNAPVLQDMVKTEGAWKLVMGEDLVDDIVAEVPQFTPPPEDPPPDADDEETTAPESTVPEAVPEAERETTVSEPTAPELTAPEVTAPETTVGRATTASPAGDYACSDFRTQEEAQLYLAPGDPYVLDPDGNGRACETLP